MAFAGGRVMHCWFSSSIFQIKSHDHYLVYPTIRGSRKYPCPPHGWSLEIPRGWGVSKAKIFKGKYEAKLKFLERWGGGFKVKNHPWGRHGYFLEPHNQQCSTLSHWLPLPFSVSAFLVYSYVYYMESDVYY